MNWYRKLPQAFAHGGVSGNARYISIYEQTPILPNLLFSFI